jgi:hypothetical protein
VIIAAEREVSESAKVEARAKRLREAAARALAEAEGRRKKATDERRAKELGGPSGPEPTRYGDWERKGIVSDF